MGMFDRIVVPDELPCAICQAPLATDWQTKDLGQSLTEYLLPGMYPEWEGRVIEIHAICDAGHSVRYMVPPDVSDPGYYHEVWQWSGEGAMDVTHWHPDDPSWSRVREWSWQDMLIRYQQERDRWVADQESSSMALRDFIELLVYGGWSDAEILRGVDDPVVMMGSRLPWASWIDHARQRMHLMHHSQTRALVAQNQLVTILDQHAVVAPSLGCMDDAEGSPSPHRQED